MFGLGSFEIIAILIVALLVVGPKQLPKLAKTLGKTVSNLKRVSDDFRISIQSDMLADNFQDKQKNKSSLEEQEKNEEGAVKEKRQVEQEKQNG